MRFGATLLLAAMLAAAAPAGATQPPADSAPDAVALAAFQAGSRLLKEGKPAEALAELERSMKVAPSPNTELLVGHALRQLGRRADAAAAYERVAGAASERVRAGEDRFRPTLADAGRWSALLRPELALLSVEIASAAGVTLTVNGEPTPTVDDHAGRQRARLWREPGRVRVVARSLAGTERAEEIDLERGHDERVTLDLAAPATQAKDGFDAPPPAAWIAGGVGALGLVSFAVFGAMAESSASHLRECEPACDPRDPENVDAVDGGERDAAIANVSLAVGVTGLAVGALLWALWPEEDSAVALDRSRGLGLHGRFR